MHEVHQYYISPVFSVCPFRPVMSGWALLLWLALEGLGSAWLGQLATSVKGSGKMKFKVAQTKSKVFWRFVGRQVRGGSRTSISLGKRKPCFHFIVIHYIYHYKQDINRIVNHNWFVPSHFKIKYLFKGNFLWCRSSKYVLLVLKFITINSVCLTWHTLNVLYLCNITSVHLCQYFKKSYAILESKK